MNQPSGPKSTDRSQREVLPLGPAVSSPLKREAESPGTGSQLLPPFVPSPRATAAGAGAGPERGAPERAEAGAGAAVERSGSNADAEEHGLIEAAASGAMGGAGVLGFPPSPGDAVDTGELLELEQLAADDDLILDADFEVPAWLQPLEPVRGPADGVMQETAELAAPGTSEAAAHWESPLAEQATVAAPPQSPPVHDDAAAMEEGAARAFDEVATRLEQIATRLRSRSSGEWLAQGDDAADPLELLITGFALGYAQGARQRSGTPAE